MDVGVKAIKEAFVVEGEIKPRLAPNHSGTFCSPSNPD